MQDHQIIATVLILSGLTMVVLCRFLGHWGIKYLKYSWRNTIFGNQEHRVSGMDESTASFVFLFLGFCMLAIGIAVLFTKQNSPQQVGSSERAAFSARGT